MFGPDPGAERVGAFSPVVLTRILKRTADEARSGSLHVVSGASLKTVHFDRGSVRFAASNIRRDRLGESMLAHDFISREDYARAVERMKNERCRFGEALLKLGRLTEDELNRELAIQVQRIVLSLFRIPAGTYSYEDSPNESSGRLPFQLPVPPILLKGLRAITDGKLILSALPPATTRVRMARSLPRGLRLEKLSPGERSILQIAGEGLSIGEIVRRSDLGRSEAFRTCFILLSLGVLQPVPEEVIPAAAPLSVEDIEPCRDFIDEQYERLGSVSEAELLGIRPDASVDEARAAFEALKAEWAEVRAKTRDAALLEKIEAIEFQLATAYAQVRVDRERKLAEEMHSPDPKDFARRERIEQLARDARLHVQVRDWQGGVPLLLELVSLEPGKAEFQAMLGKTMQHIPSMRKNAEQHFLEAVALSPNDLELRLELARYYLSMSNRSRARSEIQTVLAHDPGNAEAQRLLSKFREPSPVQKLLNKVFR